MITPLDGAIGKSELHQSLLMLCGWHHTRIAFGLLRSSRVIHMVILLMSLYDMNIYTNPPWLNFTHIPVGQVEYWPALNAVASTLSTGPVGPGDAIGKANATLINRCASVKLITEKLKHLLTFQCLPQVLQQWRADLKTEWTCLGHWCSNHAGISEDISWYWAIAWICCLILLICLF